MQILLVNHDIMLPSEILESLRDAALNNIFDEDTLSDIVATAANEFGGYFILGFEYADGTINWIKYHATFSYGLLSIKKIDHYRSFEKKVIIPPRYEDHFVWGRIICKPEHLN